MEAGARAPGRGEEKAVKQYEIWWAKLPEPAGRRPVLLLSRDRAYAFLSSVLAAEITTRIRSIPQELLLGRREGLPAACVANFDHLHSVRIARLEDKIGSLSPARVAELKRALGHALGWPELVLPE
jgi:mRNA-degrading endonuclease toxin of MazEF toxin-antitoxin module